MLVARVISLAAKRSFASEIPVCTTISSVHPAVRLGPRMSRTVTYMLAIVRLFSNSVLVYKLRQDPGDSVVSSVGEEVEAGKHNKSASSSIRGVNVQ